jgi:hypothetical protein
VTRFRPFLTAAVVGGWALLAPAALVAAVATPSVAWAAEEDGVPIKIIVVDVEGAPISTAVVRHPKEAERHRVNILDGSYETAILYMPDGSELKFAKGMTVEFEVSAPGYVNQKVAYAIKKKRNVIRVSLAKMEIAPDDEEDDPVIQFGRDKPID